MWSAGLFNIISYNLLGERDRESFCPSSFNIRATITSDPAITPLFLEAYSRLIASDNDTSPAFESTLKDTIKPVDRLNMDATALPFAADAYVRAAVPEFTEREESNFMKQSILTARMLLEQKSDPVLASVISLYVITQILVNQSYVWQFTTYNAAGDAETILPDFPIHRQLSTQLAAYLEKRASSHLNDARRGLENRFLKRTTAHAADLDFETFLAAAILLNCVERMCWCFHTQQAWPGSQSTPSEFLHNAEVATELIVLSLTVRDFKPKLVAVSSLGGALRLKGKASYPLAGTPPLSPSQWSDWLAAVDVTVSTLHDARNQAAVRKLGGAWDAEDCTSSDLSLVGRLLLPAE